MSEESNPYSTPLDDQSPRTPKSRLGKYGFAVPVFFVMAGFATGLVGLALVSNKFGNTDLYGIPVVGIGGYLFTTGLISFFARLRYAVFAALIAGPASIVLLFLAYWIGIFATAAFR